eukprot:s1677_g8.t1
MGCGTSRKVLPHLGEADLRGLSQEVGLQKLRKLAQVYASPSTPKSVKHQIVMDRTHATENSECDFDAAAEEILKQAKENPLTPYSPFNAIWKHPESGASLYIANAASAKSPEVLERHGIGALVCCLDFNQNLGPFEEVDGTKCLYFPVSCWREAAPDKSVKGAQVAARMPVSMVHLWGHIPAGTAGIACLMQLCNLDFKSATTAAKAARPSIDPMAHLSALLRKFEISMRADLVKRAMAEASKVGVQSAVNKAFHIKAPENLAPPAMVKQEKQAGADDTFA